MRIKHAPGTWHELGKQWSFVLCFLREAFFHWFIALCSSCKVYGLSPAGTPLLLLRGEGWLAGPQDTHGSHECGGQEKDIEVETARPTLPQRDKGERDQTPALRFQWDYRDSFHTGESRGYRRACHSLQAIMCPLWGLADPKFHFHVLGPCGWRCCLSALCLAFVMPILGPCCTFFIKAKDTRMCSASPVEFLPALGPQTL